jgi:hypothetical protein
MPPHGQNADYEKPMPYGMNNSNRNQFYPPHGNHPYHPKYMGKFKNRFFAPNLGPHHPGGPPHQSQLDPQYEGYNNYPPYFGGSGNPRFFPNYRYNPKLDGAYNQAPHYPNQFDQPPYPGGPQAPSAKPGRGKPAELNTSGESASGDAAASTNLEANASEIAAPNSPPPIDPELTKAVTEITEAIAAASAAGKEVALTKEQQLTLQKHEQLVQQQELYRLQQSQQQLNNPLAAKKFPNYRLLGRNIFDTGVKQQFFKKRIKANTYYSRFIKQHPTTNLPLAFQKSVSLAEDKAVEEKKPDKDINNDSDGQLTSSQSSSSSRKSGSESGSDSGDSSEGRKKKLKKKMKLNKKKKKEKKMNKKVVVILFLVLRALNIFFANFSRLIFR